MRGLTFEKPKDRYSLSECYTNFLTILRIYRTTMINNQMVFNLLDALGNNFGVYISVVLLLL